MRFVAVVLLWAGSGIANAQGPDALLASIKVKIRENLERLPDYICLQTVERATQQSPGAGFEMVDVIQLEVALIGDREMFAWPHSARFEEEHVANLVQHGTIGSGDFALHLRNVFLASGPDITYLGEEWLEGRRLLRFDFAVPLERSTYILRVSPFEAKVPFRGSFWADAGNHDLVRLLVVVEHAPPELGVYEARSLLDYERVSIGRSDFLLPKAAELRITAVEGNTSRNRMSFTSCRQYVGESSISFNRAPGTPSNRERAGSGAGVIELAPRTTLELVLDSAIDPENTGIGEPIQAIVTREIEASGGVIVPRGARVHGRVVHLERFELPVAHYIIGLEFDTLEFGRQRAHFTATMEKARGSSALFKPAKRFDPTFDRKRDAFMEILVDEKRRGQGVVHWKAEGRAVPRGLKMTWKVEPRR